MKAYEDITYQFLYDQYITNAKTIRQIAKDTGLTKKQIQRLMSKFKIQKRIGKPNKKLKYQNILTKIFLETEYIDKAKSIIEISKEIGIPSRQISKYLDLHQISRRTCGTRKGKKNIKKFSYRTDIRVGDTYQLLTVLNVKDNQITCQCKCGNIKKLHSSRIRNKQVKSCGCLSKRKGIESPLYKMFGTIPISVFSKCKVNASDRNIEFNTTIKDLDHQYKKQNGKCSISGVSIYFNDEQKNRRSSTSSLDRIDSSKGYTKDNIQWVHKRVQQMKWNISQDQFIEWCKIIAKNN
jgi:hypothetical protein